MTWLVDLVFGAHDPRAADTQGAILDNAKAAIADLRAQIDLQVRAAESIETRATAILTVGAGAAALFVGRIHVAADRQAFAAAVFAFNLIHLVLACLTVLASRARFAYGVDGDALVRRIGEPHSRAEIAVTIADALRQGRNLNELAIGRKFGRFVIAAISLVMLALSGATLFAVGAIQ